MASFAERNRALIKVLGHVVQFRQTLAAGVVA